MKQEEDQIRIVILREKRANSVLD
ncbi:hypothetical protein CGLO_14450 [Colletotrichum gloeosporioides Cg-14]|uniref:Uncharacterized protein n=1 Tax=Colletotrichum gloeosporioides (strain Cg-14) TaxID=1237896 RepID=T0K195_COLGC|nr:hypothetical protein CGLO_14450 [Colletotrichum gloeosporioides Cg-14]